MVSIRETDPVTEINETFLSYECIEKHSTKRDIV